MLQLSLPPIGHRALYDECVLQTQRNADRQILVGLGDRIQAAGAAFTQAVGDGNLAGMAPIELNDHEDGLVRNLYDSRLVDKDGCGRWAYDKIRNSARFCPYCTFGEVYEVDHFLPKSSFRELNICPTNLVPICHPCNHIKRSELPQQPDAYFLNPYFDLLPSIRWLFADLSFESGGPVLDFRVELDPALYGNLAGRLSYHFKALALDRRFRNRAANVLVEIESDLADKFEELGAVGMREHFQSESDRHFDRHGNSLEAAAYQATAVNEDFCGGRLKN
uniref:HNH endonuclease family protein n=1 Tax=Rhizobium rhizogenes TaxID=359 RepID=A0A7S4ZU10_RHIRH|nr:HNH endonuclease signature motif containing protein [Rhizobium rhizogenes]QCL10065.1 HNH endonuclease family protein [Rhizobium rhizogenes]